MQISHNRNYRRLISTTALAAVLLVGAAPVAADLGMGGLIGAARAESCCFTAETVVLMGDGTERPIAKITAGDLVVNAAGRLSCVIGVERVRLGSRRIYGINDARPFFTHEHPFMTMGGWRSVSPLASVAETPGLAVRELAIGDLMVMARPELASDGAVALAPAIQRTLVPLIGLTEESGPEDLSVFNLLLEGEHTYIANGFVVHNKGGESGGGEGGGGEGGEGGGESSGSGSGGDSSGGGEGGDSSGGEGGESSGSDSGGDSSGSGEGGESGDDGGENSEGGEGGESGGESGEGGESGGEGGESGGSGGSATGSSGGSDERFRGSTEPVGPDLTREQERDLISRGWE